MIIKNLAILDVLMFYNRQKKLFSYRLIVNIINY